LSVQAGRKLKKGWGALA